MAHLSATLAAIEQIERQVAAGTLHPGDRLPPERDLAQMLGVSRPTIREALRALSLLGIVVSRQGDGNYIGDMDAASLARPMQWLMSMVLPAQDVHSVLQLRAAIESGLARLAAPRISAEALADLDERLVRLEAATTDEDVLSIDMSMHRIVATESGSPLLAWLLESIREANAVARSRTIKAPGVKPRVAEDQRAVVAALHAHDPQAAQEAMWRHIMRIEGAYTE